MAAGPLSRLGLGMKSGPKDANALLKMGAVTSMAKNAYDLFHKDGKKLPAEKPAAALPEPDPMVLRQVPDPQRTAPSRPALTSGSGASTGSGSVPTGSPGGRPHGGSAAKKAISAGRVTVNVAKGAASGGVAGAATAAGVEVAHATGGTAVIAGVGTLAVGKPSSRPRLSPSTTSPVTVKKRPSASAAPVTSPAARQVRT